MGLGSLSKIVQSRSIVQSARANAHYRGAPSSHPCRCTTTTVSPPIIATTLWGASGLAAALVGDASLAAQEAKQLWREDGFLMFVKYVKRHEDNNG